MTLIELIERLLPYFPKLPPEVAEFFGEILLTGNVSPRPTLHLRTLVYMKSGISYEAANLREAALCALNKIEYNRRLPDYFPLFFTP